MAELGRPPGRETSGVRLFTDTAKMLMWVLRLEGKGETVAEFLESQIRGEVESRFAPIAKRVEAIEAAYAGEPQEAVLGSEE